MNDCMDIAVQAAQSICQRAVESADSAGWWRGLAIGLVIGLIVGVTIADYVQRRSRPDRETPKGPLDWM